MSKAKKNIYQDLASYKDAVILYSVSHSTLKRLATEAGAIVKMEGCSRPFINCRVLEEYFEKSRRIR